VRDSILLGREFPSPAGEIDQPSLSNTSLLDLRTVSGLDLTLEFFEHPEKRKKWLPACDLRERPQLLSVNCAGHTFTETQVVILRMVQVDIAVGGIGDEPESEPAVNSISPT
jgi:hypothetical protein